jgi:hypothetical protein
MKKMSIIKKMTGSLPAPGRERGFASLSVTIAALLLLTVLGFGILSVTDTERDISDNFRSNTRGLYMADSGIEQVIGYFNSPSLYTDASGSFNGYGGPSSSFFAKRYFQGNTPSYFNDSNLSQFEDANNDGVIDSPARDVNNPILKYNSETGTGQENFLRSITPNESQHDYIHELLVFAPPPGSGAVATVRVTSKIKNTFRTVERVIRPGPILAFTSALASGHTAAWQGNSMTVHWGTLLIEGPWAQIKAPVDKNPGWTVDADIDADSYPGNKLKDRFMKAFCTGSYLGPAYDEPTYANPPVFFGEQNVHPYLPIHSNLFANQTVTIDRWDYAEAKSLAQKYGTYYTTDASGNLYLDGKGAALDFQSLTNGRMCGIFFVDTTDRTPPNGTNLSTITISGGYDTLGLFWIGANFSSTGLGTGATMTVLSPPIIQNVSGTINAGSNVFVINTGTTDDFKVGDLLLIGTETGVETVEELEVKVIVDASIMLVASTCDRIGWAPGTVPAIFNHNNEAFICTSTRDESTRVTVPNFNYNFGGALYIAGTCDMQGGPRYFGHITAELGYTAGGTPEVWYDYDLSKGDLSKYGVPNVLRGAWREVY